MPIDARIPLMGESLDTASPLLNLYKMQQQKDEAERLKANDAVNNELKQQQIVAAKYENASAREKSRLNSVALFSAELNPYLESGDYQTVEGKLLQRRKELGQRIANGEEVDTTETDQALKLLKENPDQLKKIVSQGMKLGEMTGVFKNQKEMYIGGGVVGQLADRLKQASPGLSDEEAIYAAMTGMRQGTMLQDGQVKPMSGYSDAKGDIKYGERSGYNRSELEYKPEISEKTERSKIIGKEIGEADALLNSMEAKMPELESTVSRLSELGKEATYTGAGRAYDTAMRELGLPVRDSAIARQEYVSIVDNQILPLLRDTFGAQFTEREGETLRATLGKTDASPAEKDAVLKAFIRQKKMSVESLARQTGRQAPDSRGIAIDGEIPPLEASDIFRTKSGHQYRVVQ